MSNALSVKCEPCVLTDYTKLFVALDGILGADLDLEEQGRHLTCSVPCIVFPSVLSFNSLINAPLVQCTQKLLKLGIYQNFNAVSCPQNPKAAERQQELASRRSSTRSRSRGRWVNAISRAKSASDPPPKTVENLTFSCEITTIPDKDSL